MKKYVSYLLFLPFLCLSFSPSQAFGQDNLLEKFQEGVYRFGQDLIRYRLLVPSPLNNSRRYPLILTLHGGSASGFDNTSQIVDQPNALAWAEDSVQLKYPAFVFAPQVNLSSNSTTSDLRNYCTWTFMPKINEILDSLIAEYPIDSTRLYITGLSMGAVLTWGMIYWLTPNRFAAAIPMSGAWDFPSPPEVTQIPVWNFHGAYDQTPPAWASRQMMQAIENKGIKVAYVYPELGDIGLTNAELDSLWGAGVNHIYTEFTNGGHGIWTPTYDDPVLHRWLFAQKKGTFPVGITQGASGIPVSYQLHHAFPNPFNPSTTIQYELPHRSHVALNVYNTLGQMVATLVNGEIEAGYHSVRFNANNLASGVYFYRLQTGSFVETKKLLLLK